MHKPSSLGLPFWHYNGSARDLAAQKRLELIAIFQAILSGWILYVAAAGMLFGAWLDLIVACSRWSRSYFGLIFIASRPPTFHFVVILLLTYTGVRWWQLSRQSRIPADL